MTTFFKKIKAGSIHFVLILSMLGWAASGSVTGVSAAQRVNINSADVETIASTIAGIGPVKAQAIITYREQYGDFTRLEDLQNVPGIGQAMFERIKASLSLVDDSSTSDATAQLLPATQ